MPCQSYWSLAWRIVEDWTRTYLAAVEQVVEFNSENGGNIFHWLHSPIARED